MRYLFGFLCVCALGLMPLVGCSETSGDGGSGGTGGDGGTGGAAECQNPEDCDDREECTTNDCSEGVCEYTPVAEGTACDESNECAVGQCASGACELTPVSDDTACGDDAGTCQQGSCRVACDEQGIRDAIAAGGGPYTFDCDGPTTVTTGAEIPIDNGVILDGEGDLNIEGPGISVIDGITAELRNLTVSGGSGNIYNDGTLTIKQVSVLDNVCGGACTRGAIENDGTLTVLNCTVSGNEPGLGGAIHNGADGDVTVTNTTVSGNGGLAEIVNQGTMMVLSSTVSRDEADPAISVSRSGTLTMKNSVVDGGCVVEDDGTITSNGYNIESPGDTCGFDQATDQVNVSAEALNLEWLGILRDNGGPTMTHALGWGSVAIDVIPAAECVDADGARLTTDQTGAPRPEMGGTMCDVGAFEFSRCGVGEPDPWQPGEERLSVGVFYECGRSETIFIDDVTTNYFIFVVDENNPSETLTYRQGTLEDRLEGRISDVITLLDQPFWGGGVIWFEPIDLSAWTTMFVAFKSSDPSFATFDIALQSEEGEDPTGFSLDPRNYGYTNDGEWHFLQIPLQDAIDLGWDPSTARSPFIFSAPGGNEGDVLLIDNLYFTKD
jgi:hypothetical protein